MNKLNTTHPGLKVPFNWDDLSWLQNSLSDAIKGILVGFVPNGGIGYKISGASVTILGANYTVSEGWIFLNGEVIYVPGNTIAASSGETVYFEAVENDESSGLKIGYDALNVAQNVSLYKIRIGRLKSAVSSVTYMGHSAPYLSDLISESIGLKNILNALNSINTSYSPVIVQIETINNIVHNSNYKLLGKQMILNILFTCDVPENSPLWYDVRLPNGYQIASDFEASGFLSNVAGSEIYLCKASVSPVDSTYVRLSVINQSMSFSTISISSQLTLNIN